MALKLSYRDGILQLKAGGIDSWAPHKFKNAVTGGIDSNEESIPCRNQFLQRLYLES
jgi:hypothetical protein